jgi:hypothetical protein
VERNGQLSWRAYAETLPPLPQPRWGASVSRLEDGSYLVLGGSSSVAGSAADLSPDAYIYLPYD